jgi:hypothetical protein
VLGKFNSTGWKRFLAKTLGKGFKDKQYQQKAILKV